MRFHQLYQFDTATLRFNAAYTYRIFLIVGDKSFSFFKLQILQPSFLIKSPKLPPVQGDNWLSFIRLQILQPSYLIKSPKPPSTQQLYNIKF